VHLQVSIDAKKWIGFVPAITRKRHTFDCFVVDFSTFSEQVLLAVGCVHFIDIVYVSYNCLHIGYFRYFIRNALAFCQSLLCK